jgi:hypothetical protein
MMPIDFGWISLSILCVGRGRRALAKGEVAACRGHGNCRLAPTGFSSRHCGSEARQRARGKGEGSRRRKRRAARLGWRCRRRGGLARRKALPGEGALEQGEEVVGIGEFGGGIHRGAVAAEIALVEFGIEPAQAGAQHHAEFAGAVEADAQVDCRCAGAGSKSFKPQCGEQAAQFGSGLAPCVRWRRRHGTGLRPAWISFCCCVLALAGRLVHGVLPRAAVRSTECLGGELYQIQNNAAIRNKNVSLDIHQLSALELAGLVSGLSRPPKRSWK